jgi:hypothetical protein
MLEGLHACHYIEMMLGMFEGSVRYVMFLQAADCCRFIIMMLPFMP